MHKVSMRSIHAKANTYSADWLMSVIVNELAKLHVHSTQGQCLQQCQRIKKGTVVLAMDVLQRVSYWGSQRKVRVPKRWLVVLLLCLLHWCTIAELHGALGLECNWVPKSDECLQEKGWWHLLFFCGLFQQ